MAKALALTPDALTSPQATPQAATPARSAVPVKAPRPHDEREAKLEAKGEQVPLQVRIPRDAAKAIKVAAAQNEQTISDFMLACFHAYMKDGKHA